MTTPFVATLRARPEAIQVARPGEAAISIRVEVPEVWDVVRVVVSPTEPVSSVKLRALQVIYPDAVAAPTDFVAKLRGWEILDESVSLAEAGVVDGSILLVTHRRRRAVR